MLLKIAYFAKEKSVQIEDLKSDIYVIVELNFNKNTKKRNDKTVVCHCIKVIYALTKATMFFFIFVLYIYIENCHI